MMCARLSLLLVLLCCAAAHADDAESVEKSEQRQRARCEAIPAHRYSTGLIFNPPDLETVYERSSCFQELAIELRSLRLCIQARERKSWFFDGSGISPKACRQAVAQRMREDRSAARKIRGIHRLTCIGLERVENGHDFDLLINTTGSFSYSYRLRVVALREDGRQRLLWQQERQPFGLEDSELLYLLPGAVVTDAAAGRHTLLLRATLELAPGSQEGRATLSYLAEDLKRSSLETKIDWPRPAWRGGRPSCQHPPSLALVFDDIVPLRV